MVGLGKVKRNKFICNLQVKFHKMILLNLLFKLSTLPKKRTIKF